MRSGDGLIVRGFERADGTSRYLLGADEGQFDFKAYASAIYETTT